MLRVLHYIPVLILPLAADAAPTQCILVAGATTPVLVLLRMFLSLPVVMSGWELVLLYMRGDLCHVAVHRKICPRKHRISAAFISSGTKSAAIELQALRLLMTRVVFHRCMA